MFKPENWIGKKFQCVETGEVFTIPSNVKSKDFYPFGNCFVDVGDGHYSRMGGHIKLVGDPLVDADEAKDAALRHWDKRQ